MQTIKSVARRRWPDDREPAFRLVRAAGRTRCRGTGGGLRAGRPQLFLNSSSDGRLLRPILEAASAGGDVPTDAEMQADVDRYEMQPLFDGGELERI